MAKIKRPKGELVVLSDGHDKNFPGAIYRHKGKIWQEHAVVMLTNNVAMDRLQKINTHLNFVRLNADWKDWDKNLQSLRWKVNKVNDLNPVFAVETHYNAAPQKHRGKWKGVEVLYYPSSQAGFRIAKVFADTFHEMLLPLYPDIFSKVRLIARKNLMFLKRTTCPAVIVEPAYLDHYWSFDWVVKRKGFVKIGEAIAEGILRAYLELKKMEEDGNA